MRILLLGMNHRTAPLEVRERFAVDDPAPLLGKLAAAEEIEEAVLISTCNRVEVVATTHRPDDAAHRLRHLFHRDLAAEAGGPRGEALEAMLYEHADAGAVRHVFRVAASVDSMVVGEPQILGQVKDAWHAAVACQACGPILGRLFQSAFAAAKRVRSETRIAERPVSVARVAVELAQQIFEDLGGKTALLVGAGDMIELALDALRGAGLSTVRVANRTRERAADLAGRFGATPHGLEELDALLPGADVVLTCVGGEAPVLTRERTAAALRQRRNRPLFVIDIGVPRNVEAAVNELDDVYLYDLDDLGGLADRNAVVRHRETERAEAIVLEEQQRFEGWLAALKAVPTIRDLRARGEAVRERELERWLARLDLSDGQREGVERLTRAIVNKLLHPPVSRLRRASDREEGLVYLEAARALFGLDDDEGGGRGEGS